MPTLSEQLMFLIVMTAWMTKPDETRCPIQRQFHVTEIVPFSARALLAGTSGSDGTAARLEGKES
jgi:hypothetical protein